MLNIPRSRKTLLGLAAMLTVSLVSPIVVAAQQDALAAAPALPSWEDTSGYASVETNRATIAFAAVSSWEDSSGYASVETSRAAIAPSDAFTSQVPADVRWAPARTIAPMSSIEAIRVTAAQQALLSTDLGSMQEEALTIIVEANPVASPDYLPAALAAGTRSESAHLATVPIAPVTAK